MTKPLVIVESPAKAKTIGKILGSDYRVEASIGHIRDLPETGEIPAAFKDQPWARLAVDVDNDFRPIYVVSGERAKKQVRLLKQALKDADELYLATDEDREGEAIAWHIVDELKPKVPVKRMVFHEITAKAIRAAVESPRELNMSLVEAQEARRILDRLVGYEVSPILWRKVLPKLSAGRVQSIAVRLVVQRERERMAFTSAAFSQIEAMIEVTGGRFSAMLATIDGKKVASSADFGADGALTAKRLTDSVVVDEAKAAALVAALDGGAVTIASLQTTPYTRGPRPPFITSTLQQAASSAFGFSASRTMGAAQGLYENGYITYMRTDSVTLSDEALRAARAMILDRFGADAVPPSPRVHKSKVRNAQEAHEAIRPAGESFQDPREVAAHVSADEAKLYDLIFRRTLASQMKNAIGETLKVTLDASGTGVDATFFASGTTISDPGYRRIMDDETEERSGEEAERVLPPLTEGQSGTATEVTAKATVTKPPNRLSEAGLIKELERIGVGRPSTYASIMNTVVKERGYLWKKGNTLIPSWKAFAVVGLLEQHFPTLVDYGFTARMEDDLDEIAGGERDRADYLRAFYDGADGNIGLRGLVAKERVDEIDAKAINSIPIGVDSDGVIIEARVGRYGPYIQRGEDRASIPEDIPPDELSVEFAIELLSAGGEDGRLLGNDPETGLEVRARSGRYGPYFTVGSADEKPVKTASLLSTMHLDTVSLDDALRCLTLPRTIGVDPESGSSIEALNGRYGPYIRRGEKESRSLASEEELFTVTLEQALEIFKQPARRRGAAPAAPLREMGADPATGQPMVVKEGRWGAYVTDGETNASLRRGDDVATLTAERAGELLAERRAAGPSKGRAKAAPKKKKAPAKKKPAAKKPVAKKKPAAKKKSAAKEADAD